MTSKLHFEAMLEQNIYGLQSFNNEGEKDKSNGDIKVAK